MFRAGLVHEKNPVLSSILFLQKPLRSAPGRVFSFLGFSRRSQAWETSPHVQGPLGARVMSIFADLREPLRTFANLRGPSRTFADLRGPLADLRGPLADPIATTRGHSFFVSWETIKQVNIVGGYLFNRNCPKWGPFFNRF